MGNAVTGAVGGAVGQQLIQQSGFQQNRGDDEKKAEEEALQRAADRENQAGYGPFACFVWLGAKSTTCRQRAEFIGWIVLGVLSPIFYGVYLDHEGNAINWGYLLICGLSILLSMYATWNFRNISRWAEVAKDLQENTRKLEDRRNKIAKQVERSKDILSTLAQIEEEQSISNAQLRAQYKLFGEWQQKAFNKSHENNSEAIKIKRDLQLNIEIINRKIIRSETMILYNALKVFEFEDDGEIGLNRIEFIKFIQILPKRYRDLFKKDGRSFDDFSGGDHVIDHKEFRRFLDEFIIQEVQDLSNNHGIDLPKLRDGINDNRDNIDIKEQEIKIEDEMIDDEIDNDFQEIQEIELSGIVQQININQDNDGDVFVIDHIDDDDDDDENEEIDLL